MKTFKLVLGLGMLAVSIFAYADSQVSTFIDGTLINKDVVKLTFNDKAVTLTFSDNSTLTSDMELVDITLDHSVQSVITGIMADQKKAKGVYNLNGQYLGESPAGLKPGLYIVDGNKIFVK